MLKFSVTGAYGLVQVYENRTQGQVIDTPNGVSHGPDIVNYEVRLDGVPLGVGYVFSGEGSLVEAIAVATKVAENGLGGFKR